MLTNNIVPRNDYIQKNSKGANSSVKKRQCHGRVYQFNPPAPIWQIDGLTFWNNLPESIFGMKKDHRQNKIFLDVGGPKNHEIWKKTNLPAI